jgi:hypothetical protein
MERVLGIGGYFMRAADPAALSAWYRDCLGLDAMKEGRGTSGPVGSRVMLGVFMSR